MNGGFSSFTGIASGLESLGKKLTGIFYTTDNFVTKIF
jgi:hypothetical protein